MTVLEAVILAGGEDKRLNPLTAPDHPKCLLPVGNAPVLQYSLRTLNSAGVKSAIVVRPVPRLATSDAARLCCAVLALQFAGLARMNLLEVLRAEAVPEATGSSNFHAVLDAHAASCWPPSIANLSGLGQAASLCMPPASQA